MFNKYWVINAVVAVILLVGLQAPAAEKVLPMKSRSEILLPPDSDGKVDELIPLWLESGINGIFPMEQAAGNDIHAYRRKFGRNLLMTGGIDKRALARGKAAIDRELKDKLSLVDKGGYVPTVDHSIPPDVSYDNFCYYWKQKKRLLVP